MPTDPSRFSTIVNVRYIAEDTDTEKLVEMFSAYGILTSCNVMFSTDDDVGRFAYVAFEDPDAAEEAIIELNGQKNQDGRRMLVRRTCEKIARPRERKDAGPENAEKVETVGKPKIGDKGIVNNGEIFVHQLSKDVDQMYLRRVFRHYGIVLWTKVIKDAMGSKGYGFVRFSKNEDAATAVEEMDGYAPPGERPWHVELARGTNRGRSPQRGGTDLGLDRGANRGRSLQREGAEFNGFATPYGMGFDRGTIRGTRPQGRRSGADVIRDMNRVRSLHRVGVDWRSDRSTSTLLGEDPYVRAIRLAEGYGRSPKLPDFQPPKRTL